LIVAASLSYAALQDAAGAPAGVAGHSVGEVAALVAAGVVSDDDGMRLVGFVVGPWPMRPRRSRPA
jgi:[acyl-carrier-protein] S-malonyltransferase